MRFHCPKPSARTKSSWSRALMAKLSWFPDAGRFLNTASAYELGQLEIQLLLLEEAQWNAPHRPYGMVHLRKARGRSLPRVAFFPTHPTRSSRALKTVKAPIPKNLSPPRMRDVSRWPYPPNSVP